MRSKKKKSSQGEEPDLGAVVSVEDVTPAVLAHVFDLHGPHHNHYTGKPCKSPNCKTGIGEGGSSLFDEEKRESAVREIAGIHPEEVDPRQLLRAAPGEPEYRATTGLRNLGATCFMNALFQVLYATEPFRQGVYQFRAPTVMPKGETRESLEARVRVIGELQLLFAKMQMSNRSWLNPDIFPKLLGFETGEQQDVQEFFMLLLAHYCDECFRMCDETKTLFGDLFGVNQVVSIECGKCHNRSERRELFYVLQLPLRESVLESLSMGMQPEQLEGDNMYDCGSCGVRTTATRSTRLQAPIAPVLVLQVIRFHYDLRQNNKIKRMAKVSAPRALDMTPFVCNPKDVPEGDLQYELYAVILHIGTSAHGGHYVAHVLQDNAMWVEMDDQETRDLLPEEVGLTYAMRKALNSKKRMDDDDADAFVEDVEMWEEEEPAGGNGKSRRRGREGGASGGGGGRAKKKGPAVVEDLLRFTKGSPAPYLLFYRRREHGWGRVVPNPPPYALAQVARDNESLLRSHRDYSAVADEVYRELDEVRKLYESVIAEVDPGKESCWLSLDWLKKWVAHEPTTERVPKVDNSAITCPHGRVSPASLPLMKRISTEAWTDLQKFYGWTALPFLPSRHSCRECVVEFCTHTQSSVQEEELVKHVKTELKNEPPANTTFFYMSSAWLAQWKRNPASEALEKNINATLICPHKGLIPREDECVRVTPSVWDYFQHRWPEAIAVPKKLKQCAECREAEDVMEAYRQQRLEERRAFDEKLGGGLAKRRTMYVASDLELGEWRLLSKTWVDKYRQYLDDPDVELTPPDNSDLFCEHKLLKVRLREELQTDEKANPRPLRSVLFVTVAQLKALAHQFGDPVDEVAIMVCKGGKVESGIEECAACFESERLANAAFENQQVTIRRGTGGRYTASGYHLRAAKKPSARSTAASGGATKDFGVTASASDTIYDLKLKICQFVEGVDPNSIALRLGDVVLENEFVLSSYGITPKSVVDMDVLLLDGVEGDDDAVAGGDAGERPRRQRPPQRDRKPEKGFQGSLLTKDFAVSSGSDENEKAASDEGVQCATCTFVSRAKGDECEMCNTPFGATNKRSKR